MNNDPVRGVTYLRRLSFLVLLSWLVVNLAEAAHSAINDYSPIPLADYWNVAGYHGTGVLRSHNGQGIVFPALIFILDMSLFRGRMYLPIALSVISYATVWFALVWASYSQRSTSRSAQDLALLLAGIVIAWKGSSMEISTPFELQFTLLQAMIALVFVFLARLHETASLVNLGAMVLAAAVATYSSPIGLLLWPVLIVAAVLLRVGRPRILILSASATVMAGPYFISYHPFSSSIRSLLGHPLDSLGFLCTFLGMPFGLDKTKLFGMAAGALNLFVMSYCFVLAWRRGFLNLRLGIVVFGSYVVTMLSGIVTVDQPAPEKTWQYVTIPTAGWALVTVAAVWLAAEAGSKDWSMVAAFFFATFYASGFMTSGNWVESTRLDAQNAQVTAIMLRNHIFDPDQVRTIFPDPEFIRRKARLLRDERKAIWARGDDRWIGQDIRTLYPGARPVAGNITKVYSIAGGLKILGWADTDSLTDQHAVLFVDSRHKIVGFGERPSAGMPADLSTWNTPEQLSFIGFVPLAEAVDKLTVFVRMLHGGMVRPLAAPIDVPKFTAIEGKIGLAALPDPRWQPDANWTPGGYPPRNWNRPAPAGAIYGSWSGLDAKTDMLRSDPFATLDACLVLPLLHGRSSYGQAAELRDANTNQTIAKVPMLDGGPHLAFWRIPIPRKTGKVPVWADDEGTGPDQWTAVASPETCQ